MPNYANISFFLCLLNFIVFLNNFQKKKKLGLSHLPVQYTTRK